MKIGLPGLGVRAVDSRVYGVWPLSDDRLSIAEACRRLAEEASEPRDRIDHRLIVGQVAINLALLLREGVACLDLA